ncbi:hypothetical protein BGZ80_009525 [Entomortierella chlamydospora]|uniref:Uncharacterized protein n=1 Tax=Entomortierella chlamydospora TaxID=101097 RepID=A0A9P6N3L3_9FUNG|nr:hypothetical protein BGZ80_009525 [Entomortierella chlamydospora]
MDRGYTTTYDGDNQRYSSSNHRQQGYNNYRNSNYQTRYNREDGSAENTNNYRGNSSRGNNYNNSTTKNDFYPYQHQDNQPRYGSGSQGQRRDSYGDNRAYANKPSNINSSNPAASLEAHQQGRSSDSYASGVRSSASSFHETYDKLERTESLADRYAGIEIKVAVVKTYREMATQTTEDVLPDIFSPHESTWNGVRITTVDRSQQQNAKRGSSFTTPEPSVTSSLLKAISTPPTPSRFERSASEQQGYKHQEDNQTLAPSSQSWGDPPKTPAAQAGQGMISPSSSSTDFLSPPWENSNSKPASQPKSSAPAVDPWAAPFTSSSTNVSSSPGGGGSGVATVGWGDQDAKKKGIAEMVDWSKGVFEFPDAKPTKMVVSSGWSARNTTNDTIPETNPQQSHDIAQSQHAVDNENSDRDLSASRDPWSSGGDRGGSSYGSERRPAPSQDPGDRRHSQYRDDTQVQELNSSFNSHGDYINRSASNSNSGSNDMYRQSEDRKPMSSEDRFCNSMNRRTNANDSYSSYNTGSNDSGAGDYQNRNQPQTQHHRDGSTATASSLSSPPGRRGLGNTGAQNPAIAGWSAASRLAAPGKTYNGGSGLATASDFMSFMQAAGSFPTSGRKSNTTGGSRNGSSVEGGSVRDESINGSRPGSPTGRGREQSITNLDQSRGQSQDRLRSDPQQDHQILQPLTETHQKEPAIAIQGDQTTDAAAMVPLWSTTGSDFELDWSKQVERQEEEEDQMANNGSISNNIEDRQQPTEEPLIPGLADTPERPATPLNVEPESVPLPISRTSSHEDSNSQPATVTADEDNLFSLQDQSQD